MSNNTFDFIGDKPSRLDVFISEVLSLSRTRAASLIEDGYAKVNGKIATKSLKVHIGDKISVVLPQVKPYKAEPQNISLDIVYEDSDLLVVNKPKGMVVHPAAGNYQNTLVNAVLYHCPNSLSGIGGVMRPGILHRIDKNTSGLLIVAKNDYAHNFLAAQIKEHSLDREYEAVVYGNIKEDEGTINAPIGRHPVKRKQMAVTDKNSKVAVTHFRVLERFGNFTHMRCRLETGRTHQIRVHMSYIGHPLAGDDVYGPKKVIKSLNGQCLHAKRIGFIHPRTSEHLEFESGLPGYFTDFLEVCRKNGKI
ncbi:MAG: RluA family pseudouridine synthase [Clostridia bacterium]|nr:RluA family pseudouridine synthase [Clostridia bacterium]